MSTLLFSISNKSIIQKIEIINEEYQIFFDKKQARNKRLETNKPIQSIDKKMK